ncbi:hypothetical protein AX16_006083 [Volvariella volvacea WC 439]|nr:hypothetical protein AX16_006083 [Volvariella volvacea WC 439]
MLSTSTNVRRDQDEILEGQQRRHSIFFNSTNALFRRLASIDVGSPPGISTSRTATESAGAATGAPARGASTGTESRVPGDEENAAPGELIPPIQSIGNQQDAGSDSAIECGSEDDESSTNDVDELHTDSEDATPESQSSRVVTDSATSQQSVLGDAEDKVPSLYRAPTPIITLLRSLPIPVIDATETVNPAEGTYVSASVQVGSSLAEEESSTNGSEHCVSDSEPDGHSEHLAEPVRIHGNGVQGVPGKEVDLEDIEPETLMAAHILVALHQGSARAYTSPKTKAYQEWKKERAETSDGVPADDEVHGDDEYEGRRKD